MIVSIYFLMKQNDKKWHTKIGKLNDFFVDRKKSYIEMIKCYVEKFNLSIDIMRTHANIWTNKPKCIYRMLYVCGVMLFVFMCVCVFVCADFLGIGTLNPFVFVSFLENFSTIERNAVTLRFSLFMINSKVWNWLRTMMKNTETWISQTERWMIHHDNRWIHIDKWHIRYNGMPTRRICSSTSLPFFCIWWEIQFGRTAHANCFTKHIWTIIKIDRWGSGRSGGIIGGRKWRWRYRKNTSIWIWIKGFPLRDPMIILNGCKLNMLSFEIFVIKRLCARSRF